VDSVSHVLFGRTTALALSTRHRPEMKGVTAALVLGSILPDIDAALAPRGFDLYLRAHSSGTHSFTGTIVEALLLGGILRARVRGSRFPTLLVASWVGVLGHIFWDLADGSDIKLLRPLSDLVFGWHLVAMGDPIVLSVLAAAVILSWCWPPGAPRIAFAALVMLGLLLAVKTASQQLARTRYRESIGAGTLGFEVAPEIGRLFNWMMYDRAGHEVRAWRIDARTGTVALAFERSDALDSPAVAMSRRLPVVSAFLELSKIPFVRVEHEGARDFVLWSDIRDCSARTCDLSFGAGFNQAGEPLYQVIRIGGFEQRRALPARSSSLLMVPGGRQRDAARRNACSIGQDFAFDFDDAAQPPDDPGPCVEELVRARADGKFERSDCGDPQHWSRTLRVLAAGGGKSAGLRQ
jgi:inner membrane protein